MSWKSCCSKRRTTRRKKTPGELPLEDALPEDALLDDDVLLDELTPFDPVPMGGDGDRARIIAAGGARDRARNECQRDPSRFAHQYWKVCIADGWNWSRQPIALSFVPTVPE